MDPAERVLEHARHKALAGAHQAPGECVLASDTLVWCAGEFLPKPLDQADARRMLELLEGKEHQVWTGVCVVDTGGQVWAEAACARVQFDLIPETELLAYLETQEWTDKAGAYAIQGTAGRWCRLVEGDFNTVVGLPMGVVARLLHQARACSDPQER